MNFKDDAAQLLAYVRNQQSIIEREANETTFPEIIYPQLVPVDTTGNPFATSVTFISSKQAGQAEWINGNADDVPLADSQMNLSQTPVVLGGIGYAYGWEEINQARLLNINLTTDKALAARRAYEEKVNTVALQGDTKKGFKGLINQPSANYTSKTTSTALESGTTSDIIKAVISGVMASGKGFTPTVNTLAIPTDVFEHWSSTFLTNTSISLLQHIKGGLGVVPSLDVRPVWGLDTAAANSKHRIVAYNRNPTVLKFHMPMVHRFLPVYQAGPLRFEVPGVFRLGGLNVRRAEDFVYLDSTAS